MQRYSSENFGQRLGMLKGTHDVALARVYDKDTQNLLTIIPNIPGKSGSLSVFYHFNKRGEIKLREALNFFGRESAREAREEGKHPNIQLLQHYLKKKKDLKVKFVKTEEHNVLESIVEGNANSEQKLSALNLLGSGDIRTAEKTYGITGDKPMWEAQGYAMDTLNAGFGLMEMGIYPGDSGHIDKIPLWAQDVKAADLESLKKMADEGKFGKKINASQAQQILSYGVGSRFKSEKDLLESKVRLIPGAFARAWSYIGKGTVVMPGGIVNIGAHIGEDSHLDNVISGGQMVDGGARVGSGAQIGNRVKIGGGSGIEGVLEPKGIIPTIVEDDVRIGALCEVTGIVEEGALIASGVVMASGKRIYDERKKDFVEPIYVQTVDGVRAVPHIPKDRIAVGGTYTPENSKIGKDIVILLKKASKQLGFYGHPKKSTIISKIILIWDIIH